MSELQGWLLINIQAQQSDFFSRGEFIHVHRLATEHRLSLLLVVASYS